MNEPEVRIRPATMADSDIAWSILEEYNDAIGVVERDDREHFSSYLRKPNGFWLAEAGDVVVGCVVLRELPGLAPRACEVKRLYVQLPYRRLGVARELMDALEAYAREARFEAIYLDTFEGLAAAVRFYELRGYERVPRYNENVQATIFMRKLL
jgi:GNAT superfamily N-acetyltransferase